MSKMIMVDAEALSQVMTALDGQEHQIRELQHTRKWGTSFNGKENPINILSSDLMNAKEQLPEQSKTVIYTKSEMEAMGLYLKVKGGSSTTNDNPEEGIRFFTSLVDRIREERSVLAIRQR